MRSIRNCNVAVVGAAGFLGSHLVDHLIEDRACTVLAIDNLSVGRREFVHADAMFEHADITGSERHLRMLFKKHAIRYVVNMAACPYVPFSFERPLHVFDVNAFGAMKVINAAWESGCEGIMQIGSAEVFGDQTGKISESAPVTPHSTYGASKAAIDAWCQVRWREAEVPVMVLRQFNCYGPRALHRYVIVEIIQQIAKHGPSIKLGNNSSRDFQFCTDAVKTTMDLLECGAFGECYNMGSEDCIRIYDLARMIAQHMGYMELVIETDPARVRPWEIWALQADCAKLYSVVPRRDRVSFRDGLGRTIEWFRTGKFKAA